MKGAIMVSERERKKEKDKCVQVWRYNEACHRKERKQGLNEPTKAINKAATVIQHPPSVCLTGSIAGNDSLLAENSHSDSSRGNKIICIDAKGLLPASFACHPTKKKKRDGWYVRPGPTKSHPSYYSSASPRTMFSALISPRLSSALNKRE